MKTIADENWQKVREIFDSALRCNSEERQKFISKACGEDILLLAEVQSLLDSLESAESFLETPAVVTITEESFGLKSRFSAGQILGHYKIIEQLGAGGMGEVYLAEDNKLQRQVAIKVLRENPVQQIDSQQLLLREARAAARLEHPNICRIYEIAETADFSFIVMQYVVGQTLGEQMKKDRLDITESVELAVQIAAGLAAAHVRGVVHRDIKPANIIVGSDGQAKILDFGLAKFIEIGNEANRASQKSNSSGAVLGTIPYMSPEQLRGEQLDARTDVFSFAALFYEMLTGRQPFARDNNAETISAILNEQPDWSLVPAEFHTILRKSLIKNRNERFASARELFDELSSLKKSGSFGEMRQNASITEAANRQRITNDPARSKKHQLYFWQSTGENSPTTSNNPNTGEKHSFEAKSARLDFLIPSIVFIFLALATVSLLLYQQFQKTDDSSDFNSLRPILLTDWKSGAGSNDSDYSVSHDGKMIAYSSSQHGSDEVIYIKQTSDGEEFRVTKDNWRNVSPIWSPDDQRIAFVSVRENEPGIYVSPTLGGTATALKITERANLALRHWSKNGSTIFYEQNGNLFRLDLTTRETAKITDFPDSAAGNDRYFSLSPDEKQIAFCDRRDGQTDLWTMPIEGGEPHRLTNDKDDELRPRWHPDGKRILYNVYRDDFCQINVSYLDGRAPVQVTRGEGNYELINVSGDGTKIYYTSWEKKSDISAVNLETGEEFEIAAGIESELWSATSPNGESIAYQVNTSANLSGHLQRSNLVVKSTAYQTRQTFGVGYNPRWLPNNRDLAFLRWNDAEQKDELWLVNTVNGREKKLTSDNVLSSSISLLPVSRQGLSEFDFAKDDKRFVYVESTKPRNVKLGQIDSPDLINLTNNAAPNVGYFSPHFSPDDKLIVFVSIESFPDKSKKPIWRIYIVREDKPEEIFSTSESVRLVGWSPERDAIYLAAVEGQMKTTVPLNVKLLQISLSGARRTISELENIWAKSVALSLDGRTVAFTARRNDKDDVWTISLVNGKTKKITANGNSRLFYANLAWTADGKTILFDKQDQINTISMFENFK